MEFLESLVSIIILSVFTNNIVFNQTLGICPYLGVSKKTDTAAGMGLAVTLVLTICYLILYLLYQFVMVPLNMEYLSNMVFILVIAAMVQLLEILLKKFIPVLSKSMGIYLPLITTNCAILGTLLIVVNSDYLVKNGFVQGLFTTVFVGIGFLLALVLMSGIRERLTQEVPKPFQGLPIALFTAAIIGLAFYGLNGLSFF